MLVQNKVVGCSVQLFVTEARGLLILNLVDRVTDRLPVLAGLVASHVAVSHFLAVDLELEP